MSRTLDAVKTPIVVQNIPEFADPFRELIACAAQEADRFLDQFIGTEHLLLALVLQHPHELVATGLIPAQVYDEVERLIGGARKDEPQLPSIKISTSALDALHAASYRRWIAPTPMHLILALSLQPERVAGAALKTLGLTPSTVRAVLKQRDEERMAGTETQLEATHPERAAEIEAVMSKAAMSAGFGLVALGAYELQDSLGILWTGGPKEWRGRGQHVTYRLTAKTDGRMTASVREHKLGALDYEFGEYPSFEAAMNAVSEREKVSRECMMKEVDKDKVAEAIAERQQYKLELYETMKHINCGTVVRLKDGRIRLVKSFDLTKDVLEMPMSFESLGSPAHIYNGHLIDVEAVMVGSKRLHENWQKHRAAAEPVEQTPNVEAPMCGGAPPMGGDLLVELRSIRQQLVESLAHVKKEPRSRKGGLFVHLGESILAAIDAVEFSVQERQEENARRESNRESTISMLLDEIPWLGDKKAKVPGILDAQKISDMAQSEEGRKKLEEAFCTFIQLQIVQAVHELRSKEAESAGPIFTVYGVPVYASDLANLEPAPQSLLGLRIWSRLQSYLIRDYTNTNPEHLVKERRRTVGERLFPDAPQGAFAEKEDPGPNYKTASGEAPAELGDSWEAASAMVGKAQEARQPFPHPLHPDFEAQMAARQDAMSDKLKSKGEPWSALPFPVAYQSLPGIGSAMRNSSAREKLDEAYYALLATALDDLADSDIDQREGTTPALCRLIEACRARRSLANLAPIPSLGLRKFRLGQRQPTGAVADTPCGKTNCETCNAPKASHPAGAQGHAGLQEQTGPIGRDGPFGAQGLPGLPDLYVLFREGKTNTEGVYTDLLGIRWTGPDGFTFKGAGKVNTYSLTIPGDCNEFYYVSYASDQGGESIGGFVRPEEALLAIWNIEKVTRG